MYTLFRTRLFQRLNVFKPHNSFSKQIINKKACILTLSTTFMLVDYKLLNNDDVYTKITDIKTKIIDIETKITDSETITLINKLSWKDKDAIIESKIDILIENINKLNCETISRCILYSGKFAEEFAKYVLKTNNIKLYLSVSAIHTSINEHIFQKSDISIQDELAEYLFKNIDEKNMLLYHYIIPYNTKFCNLLANAILTNHEILITLDSFRIKHLLSRLEPDIKQKICAMISDKIREYSNKIIPTTLEDFEALCKMQNLIFTMVLLHKNM
jgi:hypothetical protein